MSSITRSRKQSFVAAGAAVLGVAVVPAVALGETGDANQASSSPAAAPAQAAAASHKHRRHHRRHRSRFPRRGHLTKYGHAVAPSNAPWQVRRIIQAANHIASKPYVWGGGHGSWYSYGYDCSGSVSYALHGANLLRRPMTAGSLMSYGRAGRGKWVTIYAHGGHAYMVVAGLRFDTSARKWSNTRWTKHMRYGGGYVARHPHGM
jgi:cell wall-associated NlpC family hydrolase